jgi:hypothetical protein
MTACSIGGISPAKFAALHPRHAGADLAALDCEIAPNGGEFTREDHYIDAYWGKDYGGRADEVLTMAMETVISGSDFGRLYRNDREMLDFIVGILLHWRP